MSTFVSQLRTRPLSPESWPRPLRFAGLAVVWLVLTVVFHTPAREAMSSTLDNSNFGSYAYFTAHHFQYGTEVVPMAGPYGFIMYGSVYTGELFRVRLVGELLLNATLAALTLWFFREMRGSWLRWAWLAAQAVFTPFVADLPLEWILLLGGLYLLQSLVEPRPLWRDLPVVAALALVSLIKGTQLILGFATLGVVLGAFAWHRQWRRVLQLGAGYCAALLLFWLGAGQNPLHLPAYLRAILELGSGYNDAMSLPTPPEAFDRALLLTAALAACLGWAFWYRRREAVSVAVVLLLAGHTFVQWKHGMVRADTHVFIYFHFAIVAALTIHLAAWWLPPARASLLVAWRAVGLLLVALVLANWGPIGTFLSHWESSPGVLLRQLAENSRHVLHPEDEQGMLAGALQMERERSVLPQVKARVGDHSIDGFGYEQGLLILNQLNYRPRPMGGGSFNVYTPWLMKLNRDFLRDPARRPDFYLLKPQTIDGRFIAADDGLALLEIIRRYQPVLLEHEHLLLAANPAAPGGDARVIHRASLRFNERIAVPVVGADEMLLVRLVVNPNWRGRVQSALYKLPEVFLNLADPQGQPLGQRRIVPAMAASPFLLSPLLETPADFVDLYAPGTGRPVGQLSVSSPNSFPFAPIIEVEFLAAPRPGLTPAALAEIRSRLQFPYANVAPESITPAFRPHPTVRYLHAPAEAVWPLTGREHELTFSYGIDPEAYEKGTTNGVDFSVEIRAPSGAAREIFRQSLRPRQFIRERGTHTAHVALPPYAAGSRLVIRTGPGEYGDNSWDWAYVNAIQLDAGAGFAPALFPGFNRVPDSADAENAAPIEVDGQASLMLHLPGKLGFTLAGTERTLAFNFGFLPGAYTNGGQTTGGDIVVELTHPGQPSREILRRRLQPVTVPADRGPQSATVDLTGLAAGDVLTVRTAPVPGGSMSWGWTYLSQLHLE